MPSIMQRVGTPNPRHNLENEYRKHLENVDPELSQYNRILRQRSVEEIYQEYLQPAFDEFNARQKRKDRRLDVKWSAGTALEYQRALDVKARASKNSIDQKGKPPIREIVWQIGNPEQGYGCAGQTDESREKIFGILQECQEEAERRYPQLAWGDSVIHADEVSTDANDAMHGSIHLHASFVPLCYQNKQGPEVQVAFERCLREMGFDSFNAWKHDLDQLMEEVLERHGLERTVMDNHEEHQDSSQYHRQQKEIRRTRELEAERAGAEERLNTVNCLINTAVAGVGQTVDEYVEGLANELIGDPANVYDDALFYMQHCNDDEFEEISQRGRQLKKEILVPAITDTDAKKQGLEKMITDVAAGNVVPRDMTWQERQERWGIYGDVSKDFWAIRADLKADYQAQLDRAYQKRRDATRSYYDALYFLRRSRTILTTLISTIWLITAASQKAAMNNKIQDLQVKRIILVSNTASFAQYSRAYRDDLKAGKFPGDDCMEAMADIIRELDKEHRKFHDRSLTPAKHRQEWDR